ncbi:hypothetical protein KC19_3G179200 [Ceratodon purpureus]|uniref:tRNA/rRNA methyltransferase SpoU type domain-containing protein n=1 Tax=Ceratodon purpureus TaxID=3225 RepID=A0A8T0IN71_CERPU|nr:hypothetical protein KC19_3G179200 [Ceratodon purpureus]KAG0584020.1 hypothetical protein KC19_3G179200 [Ceratodon purpureus]KAG0584021.1 hypothetical protein KC19_3G179200 [Ceratodon purpureus]
MQEMAMLSQAHKCLASSFFHSSCTRLSYLRANAVGSWRRELGFATALPAGRPHSFRRGCGRLLVTASEGKKTSWGEVAQNDQQQRLLQVVLVSPQIPGNTGCIARTCAATCVGLHLVEPMGFKIEDSKLKRAGLDYWPYPLWIHMILRHCLYHSRVSVSTKNNFKMRKRKNREILMLKKRKEDNLFLMIFGFFKPSEAIVTFFEIMKINKLAF